MCFIRETTPQSTQGRQLPLHKGAFFVMYHLVLLKQTCQ